MIHVAERMIQIVQAFMRKARLPKGLSLPLLNYRSTPLDAKAPAHCMLLNNHPFRTTLPSISPVHPSNETHEILANKKVSMAGQFNSKLPVKANASPPPVVDPVVYQKNSDANTRSWKDVTVTQVSDKAVVMQTSERKCHIRQCSLCVT